VKAHQSVDGRRKQVHKTTVSAFTRDALAKTRDTLAAQGYRAVKLSFAPNNTIHVDVSPAAPTAKPLRAAAPPRRAKLRITDKRAQETE
jgi:hypothetical protein